MSESSTTLDQFELLERVDSTEQLVMTLIYSAKWIARAPPCDGFVYYQPALQQCSFQDRDSKRSNDRIGIVLQLCILVLLLSICLILVVWLLGNDDPMFSFFENATILFGFKAGGAGLVSIALLIGWTIFKKAPNFKCGIDLSDNLRRELQAIYEAGKAAKHAIDSNKTGVGFGKTFKDGMVENAFGILVPETVAKFGAALVGDGENRSKDRMKSDIDGMTRTALDEKLRDRSKLVRKKTENGL